MFCRNCGSKIEDGAQFCAVCGASVAPDDQAQTEGASPSPVDAVASAESQQADMAAEVAAPSPKRSKKPIIIAAIVVALLAAGGGAGYYFGIYAPEQAREAAEQEALAAKHTVRFTVSAEGWDTSAGASRLPLHITGKEARGKKVDVVRYVDSEGTGIELRRGSYKAEVAASPIAADGTIYAVPSEKIDVKVSEKAKGKKAVDAGSVSLAPVEATEVTDDEIAAAKKYAEEDTSAKKAGFSFDAEALAQTATKRRDDAVAAKQAEEEAKRQAEEASKRAEEARQARTIDTDYFTMVLPDWFPIDEYEVTESQASGSFAKWFNVQKTGAGKDDCSANFNIIVHDNSLGGFGPVFFRDLGKTSQGYTVWLSGGSAHPVEGSYKLEADDAFGMPAEDYANILASCITLK